MGEVVEINKKAKLSDTLRKLADMVDSGDLSDQSATIIIGSVIHGYSQDKLGRAGIIWDCNFAITAIMNSAMEE